MLFSYSPFCCNSHLNRFLKSCGLTCTVNNIICCLFSMVLMQCLPGCDQNPIFLEEIKLLSSNQNPNWWCNNVLMMYFRVLGYFSNMTPTAFCHLVGENPTWNGRLIIVAWSWVEIGSFEVVCSSLHGSIMKMKTFSFVAIFPSYGGFYGILTGLIVLILFDNFPMAK